jgi:TPR repeat protein
MKPDSQLLKHHPLALFAATHTDTDWSLIRLCLGNMQKTSSETKAKEYELFRNAADQGNPFAMCVCSRIQSELTEITRSDQKVFDFAHKAAVAEFAPGFYELARCYEKGIGTPVDLAKAEELYVQSVQGKYGEAAWYLATCYEKGTFGEVDVDKAIQFAETAVQHGDLMAPYMLGSWYERGEFLKQDQSRALHWYRRGSEMGDYFSSHRLFVAYSSGELGLEKDDTQATKFYELCNEQTKLSD